MVTQQPRGHLGRGGGQGLRGLRAAEAEGHPQLDVAIPQLRHPELRKSKSLMMDKQT